MAPILVWASSCHLVAGLWLCGDVDVSEASCAFTTFNLVVSSLTCLRSESFSSLIYLHSKSFSWNNLSMKREHWLFSWSSWTYGSQTGWSVEIPRSNHSWADMGLCAVCWWCRCCDVCVVVYVLWCVLMFVEVVWCLWMSVRAQQVATSDVPFLK